MRRLFLGLLVALTVFWGWLMPPAAIAGPPQWGYGGTEGPEFWGDLAAEFSTCSTGEHQSPIDLVAPLDADLEVLEVDYQTTPLEILNNGHTIQVNPGPGNTLTLDGQTYELLQFHFHDPSEHAIAGALQAMELHLVHVNRESGDLAVVAVFLEMGDRNEPIEVLWSHMPPDPGPAVVVPDVSVDVNQLLPGNRQEYYRYFGSLTTPPCSETVNWVALAEPMAISPEQVAQFADAIGQNARPLQPLGHRFLLN